METKKFLETIKDNVVLDDYEEFDCIFMYMDRALHNSGYKLFRFVGWNKDKGYRRILSGDVVEFVGNDIANNYIRMDCNKHGVFKFWSWTHKIKLSGCSDKNIKIGSLKEGLC